MSNHGFVKTKKFMSVEKLDALFEELDKRIFKGHLHWELSVDETFGVSYRTDGHIWALRYFWLDTRRTLETRHSCSNLVSWWICSAVQNEAALLFDGTISDEGVWEKWKGEVGKYDTFDKYKSLRFGHLSKKRRAQLEPMLDSELPPELRIAK